VTFTLYHAGPMDSLFGGLSQIPGVKDLTDVVGSASSTVGSMVQGALEVPQELVSEGLKGVTAVVEPKEEQNTKQGSSIVRDTLGLPFTLISKGLTGGITAAQMVGSQAGSAVEGALKLPQIGLSVTESVVTEVGSQAGSVVEGALQLPQIGLGVATSVAEQVGSQARSAVEGALQLPQIGFGIANTVVEQVGSQAKSMMIGALELPMKLLEQGIVGSVTIGVQIAVEFVEGFIEEQTVKAWWVLNRVPPFRLVARVTVPMAAQSSEMYNKVVTSLSQMSTIFSYLPLVPVNKIAEAFKKGDPDAKEKWM
ncbi:hypothetical protein MKW94_007650, partial [Papaver nudicaule]|nr:hypothetical protein [Papaver nudicaule]